MGRPVEESKARQLLNIVRGLRGKLDVKVGERERECATEVAESLSRSEPGVRVSVSGSLVTVPGREVSNAKLAVDKPSS